MADILVKIGSAFNGDGFSRLKKSMDGVNQGIARGLESVEQLNGALGGMDGSAGKCMRAVAGLTSAIMSGNLYAAAGQIVVTALAWKIGEMKESAEAATKKVEEMTAAVKRGFTARLSESISETRAEIARIAGEFERVTKYANSFAAAIEGVRASEAKGGIIALETEKLNALLAAHSEEEAKLIEATYNMRIAIETREAVAAEGAAKLQAAEQAIIDAKGRMASLDEQMLVLEQERATLTEIMIQAKADGDQSYVELQKKINELKDQEAALEQKKLDTEAEIDILREKEKQVKSDANNATEEATNKILQLQLADKRLTDNANARAMAEANAAASADEKAQADQRLRDMQNAAAEAQREVNESAKKVAEAQRSYEAALRQYNSNFLTNTVEAGLSGVFGANKSGTIPVNVVKSIQTTVADHAVADAIRNRLVNSVADADRVAREAARAARDLTNKGSGQRSREAQRRDRILNMNERARSKADKEFLAKYEALEKARKAEAEAVEKAKKAVEDAQNDQQKSRKNLDDIVQMLQNGGLKK